MSTDNSEYICEECGVENDLCACNEREGGDDDPTEGEGYCANH